MHIYIFLDDSAVFGSPSGGSESSAFTADKASIHLLSLIALGLKRLEGHIPFGGFDVIESIAGLQLGQLKVLHQSSGISVSASIEVPPGEVRNELFPLAGVSVLPQGG